MSPEAWVKLALFMALVCACSLGGLAASGHFPRRHHASDSGSAEAAILFGSIAVSAVCAVAGVTIAARSLPWPATVIGGGLVLLAAPLLLRAMPDQIVDGHAALIVSAAAAALLASLLLLL
jgi:hypothetical protein